jgi:hypothetical protein
MNQAILFSCTTRRLQSPSRHRIIDASRVEPKTPHQMSSSPVYPPLFLLRVVCLIRILKAALVRLRERTVLRRLCGCGRPRGTPRRFHGERALPGGRGDKEVARKA